MKVSCRLWMGWGGAGGAVALEGGGRVQEVGGGAERGAMECGGWRARWGCRVGVPGLSGSTAEQWGWGAGSTAEIAEWRRARPGIYGRVKDQEERPGCGAAALPTPSSAACSPRGPVLGKAGALELSQPLGSAASSVHQLGGGALASQALLPTPHPQSSRRRAWRLGPSVLPFLSPGAWSSKNSPQMLCASGLGGPSLSPQDNPEGERGP